MGRGVIYFGTTIPSSGKLVRLYSSMHKLTHNALLDREKYIHTYIHIYTYTHKTMYIYGQRTLYVTKIYSEKQCAQHEAQVHFCLNLFIKFKMTEYQSQII